MCDSSVREVNVDLFEIGRIFSEMRNTGAAIPLGIA